MISIFKNYKKIKMEKEQLMVENFQLKEALQRANTANKDLSEQVKNLRNDFESAVSQVKVLAEQVRMNDLQRQAKMKYSDESRNY
jgi:archaellum component FlaC